MDMVEKVARAMWEAREARLIPEARIPWDDATDDQGRDEMMEMARAAIAAMREPTRHMLCAPGLGDHVFNGEAASAVYSAMIDAALLPRKGDEAGKLAEQEAGARDHEA